MSTYYQFSNPVLRRPIESAAYAAVIVDLGRPPVAGLVEVSAELAQVRAERAGLATRGVPEGFLATTDAPIAAGG
jgi:hypothetical protein